MTESELERLDKKIADAEESIQDLRDYLSELKQKRRNLLPGVDHSPLTIDDQNLLRLVSFLDAHRGSDRVDIASEFLELSAGELSNLLVKARRNRKLIANHGTRGVPSWYVVIQKEGEG